MICDRGCRCIHWGLSLGCFWYYVLDICEKYQQISSIDNSFFLRWFRNFWIVVPFTSNLCILGWHLDNSRKAGLRRSPALEEFFDKDLRNLYEKEGWFDGCEDSDLTIQLYEKSTKSKVLVATGYPYENGKYVEVIDMFDDDNDTKVKCQSDPNALCSRNFQNVKLRLDFVDIW